MKLLHIIPTAERGGIELNCYHFIRSTPSFSHTVLVLGSNGPIVNEWREIPVDVSILNILALNIFAFREKLKQQLPDTLFEKVIVWSNNRMPAVTNALNRYKGATLYIHIGNPIATGFLPAVKLRILSILWPSNNRIELRPVSHFVQRSLKETSYYSRFPYRVSLKPIREGERGRVPRIVDRNTDVRFGMVARLDIIKDHETVIRAFKSIVGEYPKAILELAGDGERRAYLQNFALELGVADRVIFLGEIKDVFQVMKHWDLALYATTMNEGLGGSVPEALSSGLAVVSGDLPMIREWDPDGNYVTYCRANDYRHMGEVAIKVLNDINYRMLIHRNAPIYIKENFSPEKFSSNYLAGPANDVNKH